MTRPSTTAADTSKDRGTQPTDALEPLPEQPRVSVVVTTYEDDRFDEFVACVDSLLTQTYEDIEVVLVTETEYAHDRVSDEYGSTDGVTHVHATDVMGLAGARNLGADHASGDVYAFIDDDAVPADTWVERLVEGYRTHSVIGVGGRADPNWPDDGPRCLPDEFLWLVGATHRGFADGSGEVRNTFGCNISFRADAFDAVDGFDVMFGKDHDLNLQGEETELSARLHDVYGRRVYYDASEEAAVLHTVDEEQLNWTWLFDRAYWQGYTKRMLERSVSDSTDEEAGFLGTLIRDALPRYIARGCRGDPLGGFGSALATAALTGAVGVGYLVARVKHR